MRACLQCGDVFSPGAAPARLAGWYCSGCEAWMNLRNNAVRLQAENNMALAHYRPEALVRFVSDGVMSPAEERALPRPKPSGHAEVTRVGLGGGARWRSTS